MRVVLVDDSESSLTFMAGLIKTLPDCEAVTFQDSAEALAWCGSNDQDLVIVDYIMPSLDGLHFIEALRSNRAKADVPVVMVTSSDVKDVRYMALQLGATDFLTKPVDAIEFLARIRNLLAGYRAHKALGDLSQWLGSEVRKATQRLVEREREAILFLARTAEHRDPETGRHLVRMAEYSRLIALRQGLSPEDVEFIFTAAPLHDVGKVGIPDNILLKPGPLSEDEARTMRRHAEYGAAILAGSTSPLLQLAAEIAHCHHERVDGQGYPRGLCGEEIPLAGRIVALADVFDALTSHRPYKQPWSLDRACAYIESQRDRHFDGVCVDALFNAIASVAVIMRAHAEPIDPVVPSGRLPQDWVCPMTFVPISESRAEPSV